MCRLLMVRSVDLFEIVPVLVSFAALCRGSREYQGHGWGMVYEQEGERQVYRDGGPIWEGDVQQFGSTRFLLAHARSAFRDEGITVENNMPFVDDRYAFVFNGELRGVKVKADGRIGAEKIFHVIKRFDHGDMAVALSRGTSFIEKQTAYVRAMNMMITDMERVYLYSFYNEAPDYFTMYCKEQGPRVMVCSQPFPGESGWSAIPVRKVSVF